VEEEDIQYFKSVRDFFVVFLVFDIRYVTLFGFRFPFIYPDIFRNVGAQFLTAIEAHVLPKGFTILTINPTDGVVADFYSCLFLATVFSIPVIVDQTAKFLTPGLKGNEVAALKSVVVPGSLLFISGALIGLWIFLPEILRIFLDYDIGLNAQPYISISSFVSFMLIYVLGFGLAFEVPVFMTMLTRFGVVSAEFWSSKWRYAIVGALIIGLILSPGVIGFTMMAVAIPIIALYFGGIYFARRAERKQEAEKQVLVDA
ncbi:Sec-independent periplasmic protein translocase, partial [mine drainage metagenome]